MHWQPVPCQWQAHNGQWCPEDPDTAQVVRSEFFKMILLGKTCCLFNHQKKLSKKGLRQWKDVSFHFINHISSPSNTVVEFSSFPFTFYCLRHAFSSLLSSFSLFLQLILSFVWSFLSPPSHLSGISINNWVNGNYLTLVIKRQPFPGKYFKANNFGEAPISTKPSVCFAHFWHLTPQACLRKLLVTLPLY